MPAHNIRSNSSKTHFNIVFPSTARSYKCSLIEASSPTLRTHLTSSVALPCHTPLLFHPSSFHHPNNVWWGAEIMKIFITQFPTFPYTRLPLRVNYLPQHPILKHTQPKPRIRPSMWQTTPLTCNQSKDRGQKIRTYPLWSSILGLPDFQTIGTWRW
jgi:hypothetical protein